MGNYTKEDWLKWLESYGAENFYDSFISTVEGAKSTCIYCGEVIRLDITIGGGVPDWSTDGPNWRTDGGDFGCHAHPDNDEEGTCGHVARGTSGDV